MVRTLQNELPKLKGLRLVLPEQAHLTLRFLGELTVDQVSEVQAAMLETSRRHHPVPLRIAGLGTFPNEHRPQVVWIGVHEGRDQLSQIASDLSAELVRLGFPPPDKTFRPHLTLARVNPSLTASDLVLLREALREKSLAHVSRRTRVTHLTVMQSQLMTHGSVHRPVASYALEPHFQTN